MTVNVLSAPPTPPNGDMDRAMFVWVGTPGSSADPLASDATCNTLLSFCVTVGVNVLFLDIWTYLGGANWSAARRNVVKKFISCANASGIRVMALAGNTDWAHNQHWVAQNFVKRIAEFNAAGRLPASGYSEARFDGVMYDVEYYTVGGYNSQVEVPGLCRLMESTRQVLQIPVGCFVSQFVLLFSTVTYNGQAKPEGQHLVDWADHMAIACYSDNSSGAPGAMQASWFQPWFDYAKSQPSAAGLWLGSETGLATPEGYQGKTRTTMELSHTALAAQFATADSLAYRGICIDAYSTYSAMAP